MTFLRGDDASGGGTAGYDGYGDVYVDTANSDAGVGSAYALFDWNGTGSDSSNGEALATTPDQANNKLTVTTTGNWLVTAVWNVRSQHSVLPGTEQSDFDLEVRVDGATPSHRIGMKVILGDTEVENTNKSYVMQGILALTANQELTIYAKENTTDATISVESLPGTLLRAWLLEDTT